MRSTRHDELEIRDEVTVREILVPVWRYRSLTFWLMFVGLVFAVLYQYFATPLYTAQVTIAPLPTDQTLSQQGSSIAGLSLLSSATGTSQGPSDFETFTTLLQSPEIAHNLERAHHVKQYLFAKSWDADKKKWTPDKESFLMKLFRLILNKPWHPPTDQDLASYLTNKIGVTPEGSFTVLSFDFKDPKIGRMVLGGLIEEAQKVIREREHRRADIAMEFLNKQVETSPSSMAQQALIALAIEWEQKKLLAQNDLDVGVEIADPLIVSDVPTSPSAFFDIIVGVFGLGFLGIVVSAFLGLFVSDEPEVARAQLMHRFAGFQSWLRGLGGTRFRYER